MVRTYVVSNYHFNIYRYFISIFQFLPRSLTFVDEIFPDRNTEEKTYISGPTTYPCRRRNGSQPHFRPLSYLKLVRKIWQVCGWNAPSALKTCFLSISWSQIMQTRENSSSLTLFLYTFDRLFLAYDECSNGNAERFGAYL